MAPAGRRDAAVTEVIAGLPLAQRVAAEKPGLHAAAAVQGSAAPGPRSDADAADVSGAVDTAAAEGITGAGEPQASAVGLDAATGDGENPDREVGGDDAVAATPWIRRRKNLTMVLGATAGVGLVTAGLAWGLHSTKPISSTPIGVVPATGQSAADPGGGLVSGGAPVDPQPATTPQFAPDEGALPPAPAMPPPAAPMPALPPDPYANAPALKAPPAAPALPNSQTSSDGLPADNLPDDLNDPSRNGTAGFEDPSPGTAGAPAPAPSRYRSDPRRYGSSGYRDPQRSNGPLGTLNDHDDRGGGPRRGPVDDAVPGLGGLGGH
jgi:hypothetical protein